MSEGNWKDPGNKSIAWNGSGVCAVAALAIPAILVHDPIGGSSSVNTRIAYQDSGGIL